MHTETTFTCPFCDAEATESAAIEAGWVPSFFSQVRGVEKFTPVCPQCVNDVLAYDEEHADFYLPRPNGRPL